MADILSNEMTTLLASPGGLHDSPVARKMRIYTATVELDAAAIGDVVRMLDVPRGFSPVSGFIVSDDLGAGVTLSVGVLANGEADADALLAATAMTTAGQTTALDFSDEQLTNGGLLPYKTEFQMTVAGAAATGTVKMFILGYGLMD